MRDPNRMDGFLEKVKALWSMAPDLRFGQLMFNLISEEGDPFYWEEDVFIKKLEKHMNKYPFVWPKDETPEDVNE